MQTSPNGISKEFTITVCHLTRSIPLYFNTIKTTFRNRISPPRRQFTRTNSHCFPLCNAVESPSPRNPCALHECLSQTERDSVPGIATSNTWAGASIFGSTRFRVLNFLIFDSVAEESFMSSACKRQYHFIRVTLLTSWLPILYMAVGRWERGLLS